MSRSERCATSREKKKVLRAKGTGVVLDYEAGTYYTHDGEGHVLILGESGTGKTRRQIDSMIIANVTAEKKKQESFVIADPKGEIYKATIGYVGSAYSVYLLDFRKLYLAGITGWNPLTAPYELWKSREPEKVFRAEQMVDDLAYAMFPVAPNTDPFWMTEARNVFIGAVYTLFGYAEPEEVNLSSIYYLISKGEERIGMTNYLKEFIDMEAKNENVAMQLYSYITTANETRGGIRSSFLNRLSIATRSEGIRSFLSNDDLHINEMSGDKPVLIYVVLPDETPIYEELAGVLISQLMNHYIYIAESKWGGKLPIRMNFCLDELGNIGRAIGNLPHLLSAGRSRNIRVELVLQSLSQLDEIYGKSNADTIISNASVKIAFRVSHWDTLAELSRLCGEREVIVDGKVQRQPLIMPSQLGAMEMGQALVMISGRTKFFTWLPDYTEIFTPDQMVKTKKECVSGRRRNRTQIFDIQAYVKGEQKRRANLRKSGKTLRPTDVGFPLPPMLEKPVPKPPVDADVPDFKDMDLDFDRMLKEIDAKIAELEEEERARNAEKEKKDGGKPD